jgi:site-specific DNA-methyltransferase (adenine-specific)
MNGINLYNVDCMEFMKGVKDKAYDLAIVDTPYGIGENGDRNHSRTKAFGSASFGAKNSRKRIIPATDYTPYAGLDKEPPPVEYWKELIRVSKNQIVWGANHFISSIPFNSSCWLVWDKDNSGDFADCELAWTSFPTAVRKFKYRWNGMLQENMGKKEIRIHPNQKPVALYSWILNNYAEPGNLILDTHGGSMSIVIACYDLGFELDLCELDKDYFKAGVERFDAHVAKYAPASEIPVTKKGEIKLF